MIIQNVYDRKKWNTHFNLLLRSLRDFYKKKNFFNNILLRKFSISTRSKDAEVVLPPGTSVGSYDQLPLKENFPWKSNEAISLAEIEDNLKVMPIL